MRTRTFVACAVVATVAVGASAVVAVVSLPSQAALLNANALFVAPSGTARAAGTINAPTTLEAAISRIASGATIYMRDGTYRYSSTIRIAAGNNGSPSARKQIAAYPGERPVLNFSAQSEASRNRGIQINGNFWHLSGLTVERAGDNGIYIAGHHNIVERVVTRFNRDTGLQIGAGSATARSQWPSNNLVVSSESHDNKDALGENADGFAAKLTVGAGNVFRYTVAHHNSDDGWDLFAKPDTGPIEPVRIENSLAYSNGTLSDGTRLASGDRNGFKLGGGRIAVNHVIQNSVAYDNGKHGFTWNSNPGKIMVTDNVSVDNDERNFAFDAGVSVFRNGTSCRDSGAVVDRTAGDVDGSNQFWTGRNGSRCQAYSGPLSWQFAINGALIVRFGNNTVMPSVPPVPPVPPVPTFVPPVPTNEPPAPTNEPPAPTNEPPAPTNEPPAPTNEPPAPPTPERAALFSDDFADGETSGWTAGAGTWSAGSQALTQSATGTTVALAGSSAWAATDVRATAKSTGVFGPGAAVSVLARAQSATSYYSLAVRSANRVELRRVVDGRSTVLATAVYRAPRRTAFAIRLVADGGTLTGFVGGQQVVTATDSTFAAGMAGVGTSNASASFDDVAVYTP